VYQPNADKLDDDETSKLLAELYNGFRYALWEPMLFKTLCEFSLTSNGADLITIEQAAERIKSFFAGLVKNGGNDGNSYPPEQGFRAGSERAEISLPFRQNLNEGVTKCADMSCLVEDADVNICWWKAMASFAYLVVPGQMDDIELPMSVLSRYFSEMSNVPVPIRDPDDSRMVGTMIGIGDCGEDGYLVDYIIVSEKAFFRKLRILAPVLKAYGAKVVIVNKDGIAAYDCDYEFTQCQP
ncbi:MAG: hypothetical protein K2M48_03220, partial [Clostridiales bacterium]|nr:hypothetical protein [Clostridiales bacterium]